MLFCNIYKSKTFPKNIALRRICEVWTPWLNKRNLTTWHNKNGLTPFSLWIHLNVECYKQLKFIYYVKIQRLSIKSKTTVLMKGWSKWIAITTMISASLVLEEEVLDYLTHGLSLISQFVDELIKHSKSEKFSWLLKLVRANLDLKLDFSLRN